MSKRKLSVNPKPPVPAESQWLRWVIPISVVLVTLIVFLPALKNGFVDWDDEKNFLNNYLYRGLGWEQLKWMFTSARMGPYTPLASLTFGFDYVAWGMNPSGYHFTSIVLHCVSAVVFYLLSLRLLGHMEGTDRQPGKNELWLAAAFSTLFFSVHPLRAESVAWLSGRHDILAGLFFMLALLWYIGPRSVSDGKPPVWRVHLLPLAAFLMALLSKGMAVSLPFVLIILDIYPLKRLPVIPSKWFSSENRYVWLEKIPYFALSLVFGLLGYVAQAKAGALLSVETFSLGSRLGTALFAAGFYVWKTIVPINLIPFYQLPAGFGLSSWPVVAGGAFVLTATITVVALRRSWPSGIAIWTYYLVTLGPVVGIVKINSQAAADRYTYLSCLGFAVLLGAALLAIIRGPQNPVRKYALMAAFLVVAVLARLTWAQTQVWRNSETLWRHTLTVDREVQFAHNNLGIVLFSQGKLDQAMEHYREAVRIAPGYADSYSNMGVALAASDKLDEAVKYLDEAVRIKPDYASAHYNLGRILSVQGKLDEAIPHYREAVRFDPTAKHLGSLGLVLAAQGKIDEAILCYREALRIDPAYAKAHNDISVLLLRRGKLDEALKHCEDALRINPNYTEARNNHAVILSRQSAVVK